MSELIPAGSELDEDTVQAMHTGLKQTTGGSSANAELGPVSSGSVQAPVQLLEPTIASLFKWKMSTLVVSFFRLFVSAFRLYCTSASVVFISATPSSCISLPAQISSSRLPVIDGGSPDADPWHLDHSHNDRAKWC